MSAVESWVPYAKTAAANLGIDPAFVLAQWLYETGGGTNLGSTKYNNLAGLKSAPDSSKGIFDPPDSIHAGYLGLSDFTRDYIRVMKLPYYKDVLEAAKPGGNTASALEALNKSPYSEADYSKSGFMKYYNQAAEMLGIKNISLNLETLIGGDLMAGINADGILKLLKENWWLVAGALVVLAVLK